MQWTLKFQVYVLWSHCASDLTGFQQFQKFFGQPDPPPEFIFKEIQVSCLTEEDLAWISLPNLTKPRFPYLENGDNSPYSYLIIKIRSDTMSKVFSVFTKYCSKTSDKY